MKTTIYHSNEWIILCETGWLTMHVETIGGVQLAFMCPKPRKH